MEDTHPTKRGFGIAALRVLPVALLITSWAFVPSLQAQGKSSGVAVIIGNRHYEKGVAEAEYAYRDALAMRHYVVDILGYNPDDVIFLRDAAKAELDALFGPPDVDGGSLRKTLGEGRRGHLVLYYSGRGARGPDDGQAYLMPADGDPKKLAETGYSVDLLRRKLAALKTSSTIVMIEAGFAPPGTGAQPAGSLLGPADLKYNHAFLIAADGADPALGDEQAKHGLFTETLLEGIYGKADADLDRVITLDEIQRFVIRGVARAARKIHHKTQTVAVLGKPDLVINSLSKNKFVQRRKLRQTDGGQKSDTHALNTANETEFWNAIKNSAKAVDFKAFMDKYPRSDFTPIAKLKYNYAKKQEVPENAFYVTPGAGKGANVRDLTLGSTPAGMAAPGGGLMTGGLAAQPLSKEQRREQQAKQRLKEQMDALLGKGTGKVGGTVPPVPKKLSEITKSK